MDDISKIPRLPGDGAQDDSEMQFNEISKVEHLTSSPTKSTALMNNSNESPQISIKGLIVLFEEKYSDTSIYDNDYYSFTNKTPNFHPRLKKKFKVIFITWIYKVCLGQFDLVHQR